MDLFPEFYQNILTAFDKHQVRYLIIGGFATSFHGVIRSTLDLDLWVDKQHDNLEKFLEALISLGYSEDSCQKAVKAFSNEHIIKIPYEDNLIEILDDFITKMDFNRVYKNRIDKKYNQLIVSVIGMDDLIVMKSKTNRYRDLVDVKELKKVRKDKNS